MGTITVNVSNDTEKMFRQTVYEKFGKGKGKLGKALDEAMKKWTSEQEQKRITIELMDIMKKGFKIGKLMYKERKELYDRKIFFD